MQNYQANIEDLSKCTVAIQEAGSSGRILGTGVIVTDDGLILTCYHVVRGKKNNKTLDNKNFNICFANTKDIKPVEIIEDYSNPSLDIAFLQLQEKKLPEQAKVAPLSESIHFAHEFASIGFRKPEKFDSLTSRGEVRRITNAKSKQDGEELTKPMLQIYSDEIEPGMSGAPVLDLETNRVIGIISEHWISTGNVDTRLNFAIPIKSVLSGSSASEELVKKNLENVFLQLPTKLRNYLDNIINETSQSGSTIDSQLEHPLSFMDSRMGTLVQMKTRWNTSDVELEKGDKNEVKNAREIINKFLVDEDRTHLVIGAPFGIGKSLFVRKIASDLAKRVRAEDHNTNYIPILVSDINALDNYYHDVSIEELIQNIVAPNDNHKKILIIFDGVDQYKDGTKKLLERSRSEFFRKYDKRKIIFTTRLIPEFPKEYGASVEHTYLRLLPFSRSQVDEFFKNLDTDVTYQKAIEFGFSDEDIRKPLIAFLVSTLFNNDPQDFRRLRKEQLLTSYEARTFLYLNFIHRLVKARTEQGFTPNEYREDKRILRRVALLMKLFRENLTENIILEENSVFMHLFELEDLEDPRVRLKEILHDYFNIPLLDRSAERRVLFLHSSLKEYLMAENYVEILLLGEDDDILNSSWMNVTMPTNESIHFLGGLLGLIKKRDKSLTINKYIAINENNEGSLFSSFKPNDWKNDPITKLITNSSHIVNDDTVSLLIDNFDKFKKKTHTYFVNGGISFKASGDKHSYERSRDTNINEYKNLWINRWISLFVMNNIIDDPRTLSGEVSKDKLVELVLFTGHFMQGYLKKLSRLNLSGADLSGADLSGADLSGADLSRAKLWNANLWEANLSGAHMSGADLYNSSLYKANLSGADLSGQGLVNLTDANLYGANLSNIDLSNAYFFNTNIDNAYVSNTLYKGEKFTDLNHLKRLINTPVNYDDEKSDW